MSDNPTPAGDANLSDGGFFFTRSVETQEQAMELIAGVLRVSEPDAIFGKPQVHGHATLITVSELTAGLGVGFGSGGQVDQGSGGGGGGGGFSTGRPVAIISVTDQGVKVDPIVDVTKLGIAFLTTIGAMLLTWRAFGRIGRE
jgi:uncharacterized spore protein YtfJ